MGGEVEYPPNCGPIDPNKNNSELVKKLRTLSEALQDEPNSDAGAATIKFGSLIEHLTQPAFLECSSREVQIHLACCYADLFRINSPECAISNPEQLREVLLFLTRTLKGLEDPRAPIYRRYHYLLENISSCETLHLCLDLPGEEPQLVIRQLIRTSLEIAARTKVASPRTTSENGSVVDDEEQSEPDESDEDGSKVLGALCSMIAALLRKIDQVTNNILDALFFYIINPQKGNNKDSYHMARQLIMTSQTSLEAQIQWLLSRGLLAGELPLECDLVGQSKAKLFEVIYELHQISPELVAPVLPQLHQQLRSEDAEQRIMGTKLVGLIAVHPKCRISEDQPKIWEAYLNRYKDIDENVRLLCAQQGSQILLNHPSLRKPMTDELMRLLRDVEESVRIGALSAVIGAAKKKLVAVSDGLITVCAERIFDKKRKVRIEALKQLLMLHQKVFREDSFTDSDRSSLAIIAQKTFALYGKPEMLEERVLIERYYVSCIVPFVLPPEKRMKVLVDVFTTLSPVEAAALTQLVDRQDQVRRSLLDILDLASKLTSDGAAVSESFVKAEIMKRIERIAARQPESHKVMTAMQSFTNAVSKEQKMFELIEYNVGAKFTCEKVEANMKEFLRRAMEKKGDQKAFASDSLEYVRSVLERAMPLQMDTQAAIALTEEVVKRVKREVISNGANIEQLGKVLQVWRIYGEHYSHCFADSRVAQLICEMGRIAAHPSVAEAALQMLYYIFEQKSVKVKEEPWVEQAMNICDHLAREGSGRAAKRAVRVICMALGREKSKERILKLAEDSLLHLDLEDPFLVTSLQALCHTVNAFPEEGREKLRNAISEIVVPKIILSDARGDDEPVMLEAVKSLDYDTAPRLIRAKVYGLKFLMRFLCFVKGDQRDNVLLERAISLFSSLVESGGDIHSNETSECERAWMRAVGGKCLLRLSYIPRYAQKISAEQVHTLTKLLLDDVDCVRTYFMRRLRKALHLIRVGVEYCGMLAVAPLLHEEDFAKQVYCKLALTNLEQVLHRRHLFIKQQKVDQKMMSYYQPELCIAYAIHFLAHQPQLSSPEALEDDDVLSDMKICLAFVLNIFIAKKEVYSLDMVYSILQMVKNSADAFAPESASKAEKIEASKKLWVLADLAMAILVHRSKTMIKPLEGMSLVLSRRYFVPMATKSGNVKVYAPAHLIEEEKTGKRVKPRKRGVNGTTLAATTSRGRIAVRGAKTKTKKESTSSESEAEEEEREEVVKRTTRRAKRIPKLETMDEDESDEEEEEEERNASEEHDSGKRPNGVVSTPAHLSATSDPGLSPIPPHTGIRQSRSRLSAIKSQTSGPQASSTPLRTSQSPTKAKAGGQKRSRIEEKEKEESASPPPKRGRGRPSGSSAPKSSPTKAVEKEEKDKEPIKAPPASPMKSSRRGTGEKKGSLSLGKKGATSPKKTSPTKAPANTQKKTRSKSGASSPKKAAEKEEAEKEEDIASDSEEEEELEEPVVPKRAQPASSQRGRGGKRGRGRGRESTATSVVSSKSATPQLSPQKKGRGGSKVEVEKTEPVTSSQRSTRSTRSGKAVPTSPGKKDSRTSLPARGRGEGRQRGRGRTK